MIEALLYQKNNDLTVTCYLCAHFCHIQQNAFGFCGVRQNLNGILYTHTYGRLVAESVDPIEKKPLYHFLPGSKSYSIATIGCNFRCGFCQNWHISQLDSKNEMSVGNKVNPERVVKNALVSGCKSIAFTYTEPTIFFEFALDIAKLAKTEGLKTVWVSNGYMSPKMITMGRPYLDAFNIDLKSFNNNFYQKNCKGTLQPVLESIKLLKTLGAWIEITTLFIPGENDSESEMTAIAEFICSVDKSIPWHVSRFFPTYQFVHNQATSEVTLHNATRIGKQTGLHFVYEGNIAGATDTICYQCGEVIISREQYQIQHLRISDGRCSNCGTSIPGVWL